jgi:hypothetical protein
MGASQASRSARLVRSGWLRRTIEFTLPDGPHVLEYSGRGVWDWISVDGVVIRTFPWFWFVPRFDFRVGQWEGRPGVVEVRFWPWLCLRSVVVRVDDRVVYAEKSRLRITLRGLMVAVAMVGLMCFAHEHLLVSITTQCYGGRMVPIEFAVVDAETGAPVAGAKINLRGRVSHHHGLETGPDGRAHLTFQPGCNVRSYLLWGTLYTVHYSNWDLDIDAEGYQGVHDKLSKYRADTRYPGAVDPPPILIRLQRDRSNP